MKKNLFSFFFFLVIINLSAQENEPIPKLIENLESFYKTNPNQKVVIQTDKTSYAPGETIWIKAVAVDETTKKQITDNNDLEIRLINSQGKTIVSDLYQLNNGKTNADIYLSKDLPLGNYFLTGLLPSHKNIDQLIFYKIEVKTWYSNSVYFDITPNPSILKKGTTNEINIKLSGTENFFEQKTKIRYSILQGNTVIQEEKLKTDAMGNAKISFQVPENGSGIPYKITVSSEKGYGETTVNLISESDQLVVDLYPEGGTLIPGQSSKIGFYAKNKFGIPIDIEGKITDQDNNIVAHVKSLWKGYGVFSLNTGSDKKYKLAITSSQGQGQVFELPSVNSNGVSLSVLKIDDSSINTSIVFADKQAHDIAVIVSTGSQVNWAANLKVNGSSIVKIPVAELPQGLTLISCYSADGNPLAKRLVNVNHNQELQVQMISSDEKIRKNESHEIEIQIKDNTGQPTSGIFSVSVSDIMQNDSVCTIVPFEAGWNCFLKNNIPFEDASFKNIFHNQKIFDYLLLSNQLKTEWMNAHVTNNNQKQTSETDPKKLDKQFEDELTLYVKNLTLAYNFPEFNKETISYYTINQGLVGKPVKNAVQQSTREEPYKKYLESARNLYEVISTIKPYQTSGGKIVFVGSHNSFNTNEGALIVIDGQNLGDDAGILTNINPRDVEKIFISTSAMDIQRYTGLNSTGVIEITTKKGAFVQSEPKENIKVEYKNGYRIAREFPTNAVISSSACTTLYWNPAFEIDNTGKMIVNIPGSQVKSDFLIRITGIGNNGQFGYATKTFKVEM